MIVYPLPFRKHIEKEIQTTIVTHELIVTS